MKSKDTEVLGGAKLSEVK